MISAISGQNGPLIHGPWLETTAVSPLGAWLFGRRHLHRSALRLRRRSLPVHLPPGGEQVGIRRRKCGKLRRFALLIDPNQIIGRIMLRHRWVRFTRWRRRVGIVSLRLTRRPARHSLAMRDAIVFPDLRKLAVVVPLQQVVDLRTRGQNLIVRSASVSAAFQTGNENSPQLWAIEDTRTTNSCRDFGGFATE
jgi:hypothetical protein